RAHGRVGPRARGEGDAVRRHDGAAGGLRRVLGVDGPAHAPPRRRGRRRLRLLRHPDDRRRRRRLRRAPAAHPEDVSRDAGHRDRPAALPRRRAAPVREGGHRGPLRVRGDGHVRGGATGRRRVHHQERHPRLGRREERGHPAQLPQGDARGLAAAHRRGRRAGSSRHVAARPHDRRHRPQHDGGDGRPGAHGVGVPRARRRGRPHGRPHRPDAGRDERHRSAPPVTGLQIEAAPAVVPAVPVRRAALAFIFVTVALDMLSLGIIVPVLPKLVLAFEGGNSASAAAICGLFGTVYSAMQFVFAPLLGALSDRFGRRPVILLSNLALAVDYVIVALAPTVGWLFVGRVLSGICGASYTPAGAYIADVTPPERRAAGFGLISAAFGLGFVLGPALGGLAGSVNPRLPFWIAAGLSLANTLYGLLVLPESLPV